MIQHDLGTALVLFAILLGLLWVVGVPARLFGIAISSVGVLAFYLAASNTERRSRLTSFADPFKDLQGDGWQAGHGLLGMSSGGIFGKGLSASQQKWGNLPEAHTDFIFAVLGEELGLIGTLLVLVLFGAIAYAAIRLAINTADPFVRYVTAGVTIWLMSQMIINIGMVLALLPVIGIPLPLVSYGGSALVPSLFALGLLIGFARSEPEAAAALKDKRGERSDRATRPHALRPRCGLGGQPQVDCPSEARLMAPGATGASTPDAGPAGRRRIGRAHLAAARHRRRPAPTLPRRRDHRARHRPRAGDPGRARGRVPARADPRRPAAAPSQRRPAAHARPAALRDEGRPRGARPGAARRGGRLRRLRLGAGLPRRPAPPAAAGGARGQRAARHRQPARRPVHRRTSRPASPTPTCRTPATSACRCAG